MRSKTKLRVILPLVMVCATSVSTSATAETLAQAVSAAYLANPTLQAQRASLQATNEAYVQAKSGLGPRLQADVSAAYDEARGRYYAGFFDNGVGHSEARSVTTGLTLSQTLFTGGRISSELTATGAEILAAREALRQTEIETVGQVVGAYAAVRRDEQILTVQRENVTALERQLAQTRAQFGVRDVTRTDLDITLGRLAAARAELASATAQVQISRSQYAQIVGHPPDHLESEPDLTAPNHLEEAFDAAEADNARLRSARFQEEAAQARVSEARRTYAPTVQLRVDGRSGPVSPDQPALGRQRDISAVLSLTQPLFTSGLNASQIRQALAQNNVARARVEEERRQAVQTVSQAWAQLTAARSAFASDWKAVEATQTALYGSRREQPFGLRQPIDVLNAEQELNSARIRLLQDRYGATVSTVSLLSGMGRLEAALLVPDLDVIRPETSFNTVRSIGATPLQALSQAIDRLGAPRLHPPRSHAPAVKPETQDALPPPPVPAEPPPPPQDAVVIASAGGDPPSPPVSAPPPLHPKVEGQASAAVARAPAAVAAPASKPEAPALRPTLVQVSSSRAKAYVLQVAALPTLAEARKTLAHVASTHADVAALTAEVESADVSGRRVYRAIFTTSDLRQAQAACQALKATNQACWLR